MGIYCRNHKRRQWHLGNVFFFRSFGKGLNLLCADMFNGSDFPIEPHLLSILLSAADPVTTT